MATKFGQQQQTFGSNTGFSSDSGLGNGSTTFGGFKEGLSSGQEDSALSGPTRFAGTGGMVTGARTAEKSAMAPKYYKEFGMKLYKQQAEELRNAESDFQKRLQKYRQDVSKQVQQARGVLSEERTGFEQRKATAAKQLKEADKALDNAWNEVRSKAQAYTTKRGAFDMGWRQAPKVKVRIMSTDNKGVAATMTVPRDVAKELHKDNDFVTAWHDKGKSFNIQQYTRNSGKIKASRWQEMLSPDGIYNEWAKMPESDKTLQAGRQQMAKAVNEVKKAEKEVNRTKAKVAGEEAQGESDLMKAKMRIEAQEPRADREIKTAQRLSDKQKQDRAKMYQDWRDQRAAAYAALQNMKVT